MIRRIDLRGARDQGPGAHPLDYRAAVPRAEFDIAAATHAVQPILDDIRARGIEAILEYGEKFDGVRLADIRCRVRP